MPKITLAKSGRGWGWATKAVKEEKTIEADESNESKQKTEQLTTQKR